MPITSPQSLAWETRPDCHTVRGIYESRKRPTDIDLEVALLDLDVVQVCVSKPTKLAEMLLKSAEGRRA